MEVLRLATGGLDLHVLAHLVGEQVPVIGGKDDRLDPEIAQHTNAPTQVPQHPVHLEPGLSDVVGLAKLVDLLRSNEHQSGRLDTLFDFLLGLGKKRDFSLNSTVIRCIP